MNYRNIYLNIIVIGKIRVKTRTEFTSGYEWHHIQPKCMGGPDDWGNMALLTLREHFICHVLLCKMYHKNHKLLCAFNYMSNLKRYNSWAYKKLKEDFSITMSIHGSKRKHTEETKLLISNAHKGKWESAETCAKLSKAFKGRIQSNEQCDKASIRMQGNSYMLGKKMTDETKRLVSIANRGKNNSMFGRTHTDEVREKLRKCNAGENNPNSAKNRLLRKIRKEQEVLVKEVNYA